MNAENSRVIAELTALRSILSNRLPGPIPPELVIEHLASCWDLFVGSDDEGMEPYKLVGRTESMEWNPPVLSFQIERHGPTALGSTRAELHTWTVDLERQRARCCKSGYRVVSPTEPRLDVRPLVEKIVQDITALTGASARDWCELRKN